MSVPFSFSLVEKVELTQRIQQLEHENQTLRKEIDRLTTQLQVLRG